MIAQSVEVAERVVVRIAKSAETERVATRVVPIRVVMSVLTEAVRVAHSEKARTSERKGGSTMMRIKQLLAMAIMLAASTTMSAQDKLFTLEDLNYGGNN